MKIFSIKLIPVIILSVTCFKTTAQVQPDDKKDPQKTAINEEIEVVRAYKPVLAEAVKIRRSPDLENAKPFKAKLTYTIPDRKLEMNADIRKLQAQQLADEADIPLRNNYVSAGAGNLKTGTGEIYINTGKDEALQAGVFLKHFNQEGAIQGQQFSREQAGVYGRSIKDNITLNGSVGYDHDSYRFYGFDPALSTPVPSPQNQHYNILRLQGDLMNRYREDITQLNYYADAKAYFLNNAFEAKETAFAVTGGVNKKLSSFYFGATASADITSTSDVLYDVTNTILKGNPFLRLQGKGYQVTAGLNVFNESLQSRTTVLPAITAEIQVVPGFATLFAAYTGNVQKTSLRGLSSVNRYLDENITIKNALERTVLSGGLKGNTGSGFGYTATAYYKTVEDMPLFVNSFSRIQKFGIVYDASTNITGFEGELNFNAPGRFRISGKLTAANYETSSEKEAWYKPGLQLLSDGTFYLNKKLQINGEVLFQSEYKAIVYTSNTPLDGYITTVPAFTDLGAGAEYRFKDKLGVYVRVNNLLNSIYQRYLFYPVNGLNVMGGLNYSF